MRWLALALLGGYSLAFAGATMSFCNVCAGYTISKKADDVLIRCPGMPDPWMVIKACKNPKAKRVGNNLTITCGG